MRDPQRTRYFMLVYNSNDDLKIVGYDDSEFAGSLENMRSTSGYEFRIGSGTISWKGVRQTITAFSTMQSEFVT